MSTPMPSDAGEPGAGETGVGQTSAADSRRGPVVAISAAVIVLVAAGVAYVAGYLLAGDDLPRRAVISGVDVGGLSREDAVATLNRELGQRTDRAVTVTAGDETSSIVPAKAGLSVDAAASVTAAGAGASLDPRHVVRVLLGGGPTDAVVSVDDDKLTSAVAALADEVDREPADAAVVFRGTTPETVPARTGITLRQEEAATVVQRGFLDALAIELPVDAVEPKVGDAAAEQAVTTLAEPAVSGPVRVRAGNVGTFTVTPGMIAASLTFEPQGSSLVASLDAGKLRKAADDAIEKVAPGEAKDATVRIVDGTPKVIPAVDGNGVSASALADAVRPVLAKTGDARRAEVALSGTGAEFSTADARALGITEVTGRFTTYFPYATYRNVNIGRAAELIDNTLLKPGDTFSLNKVVGERTKENGFTEGYIISGDTFTKELGGGVSQSATTTFNAMFFAGLKDVEHQPHSLYIDRYPPGREATVAWPSVDLRFTNDTRYGVLVQASVKKATPSSRGSITVKMWSTKTYDSVTSSDLEKSSFTTGKTVTDDSAGCEPQQPAQGFDVEYQRIFANRGTVVRREDFHWRYAPTNKVVCE